MTGVSHEIEALEAIANELEQLPMFQFFLAGRELFHSNFLFWLFKSRSNKFLEIFGISPDELMKVEREKKNIDLTVTLKNERHLYIENKFKAVVDSAQLGKYTGKNETSATGFQVILSPDAIEDLEHDNVTAVTYEKLIFGEWKTGKTWHHLGYRELVGALSKINDVYVQDYVKMVNLTLDFIEIVRRVEVREDRFFWFTKDSKFESLDAIAERIKIQDMLQKRRAQKFASEIKAKIRNEGHNDPFIDVRSNFTRKKPLVEAFVDLPRSDFAIGVQVQEDQFRRCFLVQRSKQGSKTTLGDDELRLQGRWFRKNKHDLFSGGYFDAHPECAHPRKTQDLYQKFGKIFKYQYVKIDGSNFPPKELLEAVWCEIQLAVAIALEWQPSESSN